MNNRTLLICNADNIELIESTPYITITNQESFDKLAYNHEFTHVENFVIVAELNWNNKSFNSFYGLDLVKNLRIQHQSKAPILVISHYPQNLLDVNLTNYSTGNMRYFRDPSLSYLPIMEFASTVKDSLNTCFSEPLDEKLYFDLKENLYSENGFLNEEICTVYDETYDAESSTCSSELLDDFFYKVSNTVPSLSNDFNTLRKNIYSQIEGYPTLSREEILQVLPNVREKVSQIVPHVNETRGFQTSPDTRKGKVLYVDSKKAFGKKIKLKLFEEGIQCQLAYSIEEAVEILANDDLNEITTLVCDYRFLKKNRQYQRKQAYHLAEEIAKLPNMVNMVILNGINPSALSTTTLLLERLVVTMQKNEVFDTDFGLDKITSIIKKLNKDALEKIDGSKAFKNTTYHKLLYKEHRESEDYYIAENDIADTALFFVRRIVKDGHIPKYLLPNLSGRLNNKKSDKDLSNFRDVLMARRFVLGLCQLPFKTIMGFEQELNRRAPFDKKDWWYVLYNALKNGELKLNHDEILDSELHNVINRNLKMSIKQNYNWQVNKSLSLTVEEKKWLSKYCKEFSELHLS